MDYIAALMFVGLIALIFSGYPVAFALGGVSVVFSIIGISIGAFDLSFLGLLPNRVFGIMSNMILIAIPFFIFMGMVLERAGLAAQLLDTVGQIFGPWRGGVAIAVVVVGVLLAATTGVVAAAVVAMGLISLPTMLKYGYSRPLATGVIAASGTLAQVIPPSIVLVVLGDQMGVSVGDLFMGALLPGLLLAGLYLVFVGGVAWLRPGMAPALPLEARPYQGWELARRATVAIVPPVFLIVAVLGSIFLGIATPTEAGAVGSLIAVIMAAAYRRLTFKVLYETMTETARFTTMVIWLLIGASAFGLVFGGLGGSRMVKEILVGLPGGEWGFIIFVMLVVFILGFFLDFFEIAFIIIPLVMPAAEAIWEAQAQALIAAGHWYLDPMGYVREKILWFAVVLAVNFQTSFLTPPFGFALFYLRGVSPPDVQTLQIYRGIIPFVVIQLIALGIILAFPAIVNWLPGLRAGW
jgi:tripartite ATP-independent transporter DctM subunit